ncbi:MAG: efflux RND transporter periplasmic adaptor subunit [Paludibacteraceae bacterium]|nr:efflux RND transporter periplasmic adaptor subunit [Paludibacteraceae bacterium]MBP6284371.1 efflux RND transporter periplasmic adaptor subunit [Paludibacteraceae bacterium]
MKKVLKIVVIILLIALVIGTFFMLWKKSQPEKTTFSTTSPLITTIEKKTVATGKVEPRTLIEIKPNISGIIIAIYKEAGQTVKAGDVIAKVQVIPDMLSLSSAESRINRAKIALEKAQLDYNRQKKLFDKGVISQEAYQESSIQLKISQVDLLDAQNSYDLLKEGITRNSDSYSNTLIRSTIDGMILDIPQKVGSSVILSNTFNAGTTIATIANMKDMIFIGKIDETEVGRIAVGMPVVLVIGALEGLTFDAELEYISPQGTSDGGAVVFDIKAAVTMPSDVFIRSGYSANAQIVLEKKENILALPESTLLFENDSVFVEVQTADTLVFEKRAVQVGLSDGINIELLKGVTAKEKLKLAN